MKAIGRIGLIVLAAVALTGCASMKGGTIGAVQTLDDSLAAKYGIPASVVSQARSALGIVDVRTLPDSNQVLPAGYTWTQDILDASNRVVDVSAYHYSAPRIVQAGQVATAPVTIGALGVGTTNSLAGLDQLLATIAPILKANPALLAPAK